MQSLQMAACLMFIHPLPNSYVISGVHVDERVKTITRSPPVAIQRGLQGVKARECPLPHPDLQRPQSSDAPSPALVPHPYCPLSPTVLSDPDVGWCCGSGRHYLGAESGVDGPLSYLIDRDKIGPDSHVMLPGPPGLNPFRVKSSPSERPRL